jgi:hypothetical protein
VNGPLQAGDLYAMLGLSRDASTSRLRWAYEQAMADATRCGDRKRALALSRAYDGLASNTRRGVYAPVLDAGGPPQPPDPPSRVRSTFGEPARRGSERRRSKSRRKAILVRVVVYLVGIPVAVAAGAGYYVHNQQLLSPVTPATNYTVQQIRPAYVPPAPVPPAPTIYPRRSNARVVPVETPTDEQGFVTVVCQPRPARAGYAQLVRPGSIVTCSNGAIPKIVG